MQYSYMNAGFEDLKEPWQRLRWAREQRSYNSARAAAEAMGVAYPTYAGHENGTTGFRHTAERYAAFFRVSLDWLLTGRGSPDGRSPVQEIYEELPPDKQRQAMDFLQFLRDQSG